MSLNRPKPHPLILIAVFSLIILACGNLKLPLIGRNNPTATLTPLPTPIRRVISTPTLAPIAPEGSAPNVTLFNPIPNQEIYTGQQVNMMAQIIGIQRIIRVEFWLDEEVFVEKNSPGPQPGIPYDVSEVWSAQAVGLHLIEVRAYNSANKMGSSGQIFVQVVPPPETPTPTPTPVDTATPTPETPQPTATPDYPYALILEERIVQVYGGPGSDYTLVGQLGGLNPVEILGQNNIGNGLWWQIRYDLAPNGIGWIPATESGIEGHNIDNVRVVAPPETPVPPTPTATATPVPPPGELVFEANPNVIHPGECTTIRWYVTNVYAVYFQGEGVAGTDQTRTVCPGTSTVYRLQITKYDQTQEEHLLEVKVQVSDTPHQTFQVKTNQSLNFDRADKVTTTGDDFKWSTQNNQIFFEKWDDDQDLKLAWFSNGNLFAWDALDEETCRTHLNRRDSDRIALFAGDIVCIRSDDGNLGKLRFDEVQNDHLLIQSYVW